jgi:hypothetical protein
MATAPAKKAAAPAAAKPKVEEAAPEDLVLKAPVLEVTHAQQLCALCGVHPLGDGATHFTCEHGSWALEDGTWVKQ